MSRPRLLRRLAGRDDDRLDDVRRLLAIRQGSTPIRPELGLPDQPPWLPDASSRRRLQEAIAATLRAGEPRLGGVAVAEGGDAGAPVFTIRGTLGDGGQLGAIARRDASGRLEVAR